MGLNTQEAVRHEIERIKKKNGKSQPWHVWYFKCATAGCNNEIKLRKANLATATGKCKVCNSSKRPYEALYNNLCLSAKSRNEPVPVDMTYEEFVRFTGHKQCSYCDSDLNWTATNLKKHGASYNLDRKDNTKGYTVENCVPCCRDCNFFRQDKFTHEEFLLLRPGLKKIMKARTKH